MPELLRGCPLRLDCRDRAAGQDHWSQVLAAYDGVTMRLYVNGMEVK